MRRFSLLLALLALQPVGQADADSQSFTLSTGYNESALTPGFNRGTVFLGQATRGHLLYQGSLDSRGLGSIGIGRISSLSDIDCNTSRYPVLTLFARSGEGPGFAIDLHQDWYWRGTPARIPDKHVTMFQTQGGIICQDGHAPKVRVTHRFVTSERRFPGRTQGVEWVWEFRQDYPAVYSPVNGGGEMTALSRRSMRLENWIFFSREAGFGVVRVNLGATYKTVVRDPGTVDPGSTPLEQARKSGGVTRVPVLMFRLGYEIRRW